MDTAQVKRVLQLSMQIVDETMPLVVNRDVECTVPFRSAALQAVFCKMYDAAERAVSEDGPRASPDAPSYLTGLGPARASESNAGGLPS